MTSTGIVDLALISRSIQSVPPTSQRADTTIHTLIPEARASAAVIVEGKGRHSMTRGAAWAVNLVSGDVLHHARHLPFSIPVPRAVTIEGLRGDLDVLDRQLARARSIQRAVDRVIALLNESRRETDDRSVVLSRGRWTPRAPQAYSILANLGPMMTMQLVRGFEVSRLGMTGILKSLADNGLVRREGQIWRAIEIQRVGVSVDDHKENASDDLTKSLNEFDAHMAKLEQLLNKKSG